MTITSKQLAAVGHLLHRMQVEQVTRRCPGEQIKRVALSQAFPMICNNAREMSPWEVLQMLLSGHAVGTMNHAYRVVFDDR